MTKENLILDRTFDYALRIIELYRLMAVQKEYVLSKQMLRSGTSIGANVEEACAAYSKKILLQKCLLHPKKPGKQDTGSD